MKNNLGYTIVELLAVTAIIVIIGSLITGIFYSTLRGSNKAKVFNTVSKNGNYALSAITDIINSSVNIESISGEKIVDCVNSNSGDSITFKRIDEGFTTISCVNDRQAISSTSAETEIDLTDSSQVKVEYCVFTCVQSNKYSKPRIDIDFMVSQKLDPKINEGSSAAIFKTSISLRNYNP